MDFDIIVAGAGVAGLMTGKLLSEAGLHVCILEAADRAGGRIASQHEPAFGTIIERGAEFLHGDVPLTLALLNEARIAYHPVSEEMVTIRKGRKKSADEPDSHWRQLMKKMKSAKEDTTLDDFLQHYFGEPQYEELRSSARRFAAGFDLADSANASIKSLCAEWNKQEEEQYRIDAGYGALIHYLEQSVTNAGGIIRFSSAVSAIDYSGNNVIVTAGGGQLQSRNAVLTVSNGVLKRGSIKFKPSLSTSTINAIDAIGFGDVIKFHLLFTVPFWEEIYPDAGFLLSDEVIPTWWTQLPKKSALITGWVGGPPATALASLTNHELQAMALQSIANATQRTRAEIEKQLLACKVTNWKNDPLTLGGYSYSLPQSAAAKELLSRPVEDRIWFAGEAIYSGTLQGTVEAALQSARRACESLLINWRSGNISS